MRLPTRREGVKEGRKEVRRMEEGTYLASRLARSQEFLEQVTEAVSILWLPVRREGGKEGGREAEGRGLTSSPLPSLDLDNRTETGSPPPPPPPWAIGVAVV